MLYSMHKHRLRYDRWPSARTAMVSLDTLMPLSLAARALVAEPNFSTGIGARVASGHLHEGWRGGAVARNFGGRNEDRTQVLRGSGREGRALP